MEKSQAQLLQEFREEIAALKEKLGALEERISDWQAHETRADDEAVDFTDIEIGLADPVTEAATEVETKRAADPAAKPAAEPVAEPVADDTAGLPWRKDKPGLQVKNIRSGISLLDRALFIGSLFKEDFALYDKTIAALNGMSSLDEAVSYIREHFPAWNLKSDVVYHFMMSIRKKLG